MESWWRLEAFLLLASHVFLFGVAFWFFAKVLYRDYEVKQRYIQVLFALTFSASCSMFQLMLATMAGMLDPTLSIFAWKAKRLIFKVFVLRSTIGP